VKDITVIIKQGAQGSILCEEGSGSIIETDAFPLSELGLKVVNTVGCGDAFIGGFASGLVEGKNHFESLRLASAAGSYKATRIETRGGPTAEQLYRLMELWDKM
jgi:tagatose 6-phosphate kinase